VIKIKKEFIDITGQKFGRLTVLYKCDYKIGNEIYWHCLCDCGKEKDIQGKSIRYGKTKSCGCLHDERIIEYNKTVKAKYNTYDLSGEYGIGWTSNTNKEFYFDLEDYDKIKDYCWYEDKHGYICASDKNNQHKQIFLHRTILDLNNKDWRVVQADHIRHKKFDNRKSELRITNGSQNSMNRATMVTNKSGETGVYYYKNVNRWYAYITKNYETISLGWFDDFEDAVKARKKAEEEYFGEFAYDYSITRPN
jgi:hypothetical protein